MYLPASLATECRSSACRVKLTYDSDAAYLAAKQSNLDLRLLEALRSYGFVALEEAPDVSAGPNGEDFPMREMFYWKNYAPSCN